jgi:hypothetical protein
MKIPDAGRYPMAVSLDDLERTLDLLEENFEAAAARAPDDAARKQLRHALVAARDAFWKASRENLEDDNPFVTKLVDELKEQNQKLADAADGMQDFVAFLDAATEAVKLGAAIATLAAA